MAEPISTPRINSTYLDSFTNQTVRLLGKVVQLRGEQATIDAGGNVTAHLNRVHLSSPSPFQAPPFSHTIRGSQKDQIEHRLFQSCDLMLPAPTISIFHLNITVSNFSCSKLLETYLILGPSGLSPHRRQRHRNRR